MRAVRRRTWALGWLAALALVFGCAPSAPPGDKGEPGKATPAASADKTIRVVRNVGGREGFKRHWEAWQAAFEKANPGWTLELINVGDSAATEFYKSRIASGDLPEVIQTWSLTKFLADNGHIVPLPDEYFTKFGMPLPTPYKGKRYATMGGLQVIGMAVNRKAWQSIGITEPPATWAAFTAALDKLAAKGTRPMTYGAQDWCAAFPLTALLHVNLYPYSTADPDPAKPSFTLLRDQGKATFAGEPTAKRILERVIALVTKYAGKGVLSDGYEESKRDFYGGGSATWLMGCWIGGDLEPNNVTTEVAYWPLPALADRPPIFVTGSSLQTGWAITTSATGEKQAKALAACEALYDPATYQAWLNGEAMLATATKVADVTGPQTEHPVAKAFVADLAANVKRYGTTRGAMRSIDDQWPQGFEDACQRLMQNVLTGERDSAKLLGELDKAWDTARKSK